MIIFPAIDLRNGKAVRLVEGDFKQETVFGRGEPEPGSNPAHSGESR